MASLDHVLEQDFLHVSELAAIAAGRTVGCPTVALWGAHSYVGRNFDVLATWAPYAPGVTGAPIEADHYLAEEAPEATAAALREFFVVTEVAA